MGIIATLKTLAPLSLYVAGIIILFLSLSGKVRYGLFFLIPLLPLQNVIEKLYQFPLGNNLNDILFIGMLIGWVMSKGSSGKKVLEKNFFNGTLFFYLIFTYITLWIGSVYLSEPYPISPHDPRLQTWKNYMLLPLIFFLTYNNLENKKQIIQLIICMCCAIFLMDYYNVNQVRFATSWVSRTKINGTFTWLGVNEVAAFHATYTFVLLGLFFFIKKKLPRMILGGLVLINFYIVLFMFSRGAYLSVLMGVTFLAVIKKRILIIPLVILFVSWQTILPQKVLNRLQYTEVNGELDKSASDRLVFWGEGWGYFQSSPIVGIGFNTFSRIGMKRDAHNLFLRTLAEQGLIGIIFLLIIMLRSLRQGWVLYVKSDDRFFKGLGLGFCACVIATMVGNFFGDRWTYLPLGAFFWAFLGMVERANFITTQNKSSIQTKQKINKINRYNRR